MNPPDLGLLLDVDGPVASPVTRTIAIGSIARDLVDLVAAGVPIAFITGRSHEFIADVVIPALQDVGLRDALLKPGARMFGVFEKGGAWSTIDADGMSEPTIDQTVALGADAVDAIRDLVERRFADTMFFDETKRAMISVEQRTDVGTEDYRPAQQELQDEAFRILTAQGVGLRYAEQSVADADGAVPFRIDPTVISTDIESIRLDKDHAAQRALEHFRAHGPMPRRWLSVGDSRSDYLMADQLHAEGFDTAHLDVRPGDGMLERPYPVLTEDDLIHDEAFAAHLTGITAELGV
ncbi:hypothetical protein [Microbacterium sp. AK031]|uniref:hypothetical protein n=1 Tax=Microbacterium sp. AK031 TaxID=2723076 RepID=UPI0021695569|nr:hypothetical protein [Microbacterium sp. AK031]MCS3843396.1 phosphoglycolate phosphatase-like HAD superfamily hydrolase [Microbacterium sp. AK031]